MIRFCRTKFRFICLICFKLFGWIISQVQIRQTGFLFFSFLPASIQQLSNSTLFEKALSITIHFSCLVEINRVWWQISSLPFLSKLGWSTFMPSATSPLKILSMTIFYALTPSRQLLLMHPIKNCSVDRIAKLWITQIRFRAPSCLIAQAHIWERVLNCFLAFGIEFQSDKQWWGIKSRGGMKLVMLHSAMRSGFKKHCGDVCRVMIKLWIWKLMFQTFRNSGGVRTWFSSKSHG